MISNTKSTDKIFTYDVILWLWRHRNDSFRPEMNSDELSGHFDTHKDPLKWFHPDCPFYHVTKTPKKGWSGRFRTNSTMPMFFYAHDNPKNTSSVQPWATLRDFVSSVMLAEFYLYISSYDSFVMNRINDLLNIWIAERI